MDPKGVPIDRWLQLDAVPLLPDDGSVEQIVVSYVDLTARVQAEAALRESEERFRTLVDTAPIDACITDERGIFTTANSAYCAMYGYRQEELIGRLLPWSCQPSSAAACRRRTAPVWRPVVRRRRSSSWSAKAAQR